MGPTAGGYRIAELQFENSRLRRPVTDPLLEKIRLEDAAKNPFARIRLLRIFILQLLHSDFCNTIGRPREAPATLSAFGGIVLQNSR
jgi:hypothetical protein